MLAARVLISWPDGKAWDPESLLAWLAAEPALFGGRGGREGKGRRTGTMLTKSGKAVSEVSCSGAILTPLSCMSRKLKLLRGVPPWI